MLHNADTCRRTSFLPSQYYLPSTVWVMYSWSWLKRKIWIVVVQGERSSITLYTPEACDFGHLHLLESQGIISHSWLPERQVREHSRISRICLPTRLTVGLVNYTCINTIHQCMQLIALFAGNLLSSKTLLFAPSTLNGPHTLCVIVHLHI